MTRQMALAVRMRPADRERDSTVVARLIYDTDPYLFPFLFGWRRTALPVLEKLFTLERNSFSYRHVQVAEWEGEIAGILIAYDPTTMDKNAEQADFRRVLTFWQQLLMQPKYWLLGSFLDKSEVSGQYVQNLCVDTAFRGKGIGTQMLRQFCESSSGPVWLDVESGNDRVRALYERLGFTIVREIPVFLPGLGSLRMLYNHAQA